MFHRSETVDAPLLRVPQRMTERGFLQPWLVLPLLLGLVFGSFVGLFSSCQLRHFSVFSADTAGLGFWGSLWQGSCFVFAALLLATTFLGFALLPFLSAFFGFLLGNGVASAFQTNGFSGLITSFLSFGLPAFFVLPAFLVAVADSGKCSLQLLRCFSRGERLPMNGLDAFPRHIALIALLCFAEALYSAFLLPILLNAVR